MPHITLEITDNVKPIPDSGRVLLMIHRLLEEHAGIDIENCKSRSVIQSSYTIGNGSGNKGFVHLQVRFLEGRSLTLKQELGQHLLKILDDSFAEACAGMNLQITVEISDIARDLYFKSPG